MSQSSYENELMTLEPTLLRMTDQNPFPLSRDNVPHAHSAVIAARNEGATTSRQSTDSMVVSFEMQPMIWIIVDFLLREG